MRKSEKIKRYIAFLRGINISGKNKIVMSDLKAEFERMKFLTVSTYLNSGNVLFTSENDDVTEMKDAIEEMIRIRFDVQIPVYIISQEELADILAHAPVWWGTGNKDKYDNLIFIITSDRTEKICDMIGQPSDGLEKIEVYKNSIFWTFERKSYQKCNWWKKTARDGIAEKLTIRTANTLRKICKL